jgi:SAM-dependent methyltransferase
VDRLTYAAADYTLRDQELMSAAHRYFEWQARLILPELGSRVLEVGCGTGNFTQHLLDREAVIAVDIEPACIERLRMRFPGRANLTAAVESPERESFATLARYRPECCVCLNVLEHVEDDALALRAMASVLPRGGAIVLLVPAFPALYGSIDRNLGHYRRYTRASLRRIAAAANLNVMKMRYMNAIGFWGWWINGRILRRERQSAAQIAVFDRWIVPLLSRVESICPPPFGQSLIAVLQKR